MPAGYQGVDVHAFSYVVDPLKEAGEYDEDKPNLAMQKYLNDVNFQNKFLPRWMGVVGDDRMPTLVILVGCNFCTLKKNTEYFRQEKNCSTLKKPCRLMNRKKLFNFKKSRVDS